MYETFKKWFSVNTWQQNPCSRPTLLALSVAFNHMSWFASTNEFCSGVTVNFQFLKHGESPWQQTKSIRWGRLWNVVEGKWALSYDLFCLSGLEQLDIQSLVKLLQYFLLILCKSWVLLKMPLMTVAISFIKKSFLLWAHELNVKTARLSETNMALNRLPNPTSPQTRPRWKGKQPVFFALSSLRRVNGAAPCLWPDFGLPACLAKGPVVVEREGPFLEAKWELNSPHTALATKPHICWETNRCQTTCRSTAYAKKKGWPWTLGFEAEFISCWQTSCRKRFSFPLRFEQFLCLLQAELLWAVLGRWAVLSRELNLHHLSMLISQSECHLLLSL